MAEVSWTSSGHQQNLIYTVSWKLLNGPGSCTIENPNSLTTKVTGLKEGKYRFSISVTDKYNRISSDTLWVFVRRQGDKFTDSVVFTNLVWQPIWDVYVEVKNFYNYVSEDQPYSIYIRRDGNDFWEEIPGWTPNNTTPSPPYGYFIETRPNGAGMYHYGSLYIWVSEPLPPDTPDVKIMY